MAKFNAIKAAGIPTSRLGSFSSDVYGKILAPAAKAMHVHFNGYRYPSVMLRQRRDIKDAIDGLLTREKASAII